MTVKRRLSLKPRRAATLAAFLLLASAGEVRAWGDDGHRVVCEIAFRLTKPETQAAIEKIMKLDVSFRTFSESCVFPDHPRIRTSEHFVRFPRDSTGFTSEQCPQSIPCLLTAVLDDFRRLKSTGQSGASRLLALKSLGHWVGDIHQPLHVSFGDDKGGNTVRTDGKCGGNFHDVWDICLVEYAIGTDEPAAAARLRNMITPAMRAKWGASQPRDWANESFAISEAVQTRYCKKEGSFCNALGDHQTIDEDYLRANSPVVIEQFKKAGTRLAALLDKAMGKSGRHSR